MHRTVSFACATALALIVALGTVAPAARRNRAPEPAPSPRIAISGEGDALSGGADGDRNGLFGFASSLVRGGVRIGFCTATGDDALAGLFGAGTRTDSCAASPQPPDFVAASVPLRADAPVSLGGRGQAVQIPFVARSVAIVYDNPDVRGRLRLAVDALCRIAGGSISNWNQLPVDPANPSGLRFPARPLHFVIRTDANGETFALSNFLSSTDAAGRRLACARPEDGFALGSVFDAANTTAVPAPRFGVIPATVAQAAGGRRFLGARGDDGELACITGAPRSCGGVDRSRGGLGTIGYADTPDAIALRPPATIATLFVLEHGIPHDYDPVTDLPGVATHLDAYVVDRGLGRFVANGRPHPELLPFAVAPAHAGCIGVVPPSAYAFPDVGYPIVEIANLTFASAGNGLRAPALRVLGSLANESANFTEQRVRSIDPDGASTGTTGYSVLPLPTKKKTGIPSLVHCIGR